MANIFMSDMVHSLYNAWCQVIEVPKKGLFCTWHVDRAWRNNLKKINSTEKQLEVYKILCTLLEERDYTAFLKMITEAISLMLNDDKILNFENILYPIMQTVWKRGHIVTDYTVELLTLCILRVCIAQ